MIELDRAHGPVARVNVHAKAAPGEVEQEQLHWDALGEPAQQLTRRILADLGVHRAAQPGPRIGVLTLRRRAGCTA